MLLFECILQNLMQMALLISHACLALQLGKVKSITVKNNYRYKYRDG